MTPSTEIDLFTAVISSVLTYAWWIHFRVWMLRQDLFEIRDDLWDEMSEKGELDDPAHRETREGINSMIRFSPYLSIRTLILIATDGAENVQQSTDLPQAVVEARKAVFNRIMRFMLLETVTGLACTFLAMLVMSHSVAISQMQKWISRIFDSSDVRTMEIPRKFNDPFCPA